EDGAADVLLPAAEVLLAAHVLGGGPAEHLHPGGGGGRLAHGAPGAAAPALLERRLAHGAHPAQVLAALRLDDHRVQQAERLGIGEVEQALAVPLEPHLDRLRHHASAKAPIAAYFSARRRTSRSGRTLRRSATWRMRASRSASPVASGSAWAPPGGSGT